VQLWGKMSYEGDSIARRLPESKNSWRRQNNIRKSLVLTRGGGESGDPACSRTHPEVEAVEGGMEVAAGPQAVHLHGHLGQEQAQEHKLCQVCTTTQWGHGVSGRVRPRASLASSLQPPASSLQPAPTIPPPHHTHTHTHTQLHRARLLEGTRANRPRCGPACLRKRLHIIPMTGIVT